MFNRLAGNQQVKDLLSRMLTAHRMPGALLFAGPEGAGKKLFALEVAKALNCQTPTGIEPCDTCASCKRIGRVNYPDNDKADDWEDMIRTDHADVGLIVAPRRVILVKQMREIEREANYRPFEGKARVFLIDDADKLNDNSANALLKVLEEPPSTSHIILITSRPAMLLPTIRSRTHMIRFAPLTVEEIERHLIEHKIAPAADARLQARLAAGSMRRAMASDVSAYKAVREELANVVRAAAVDSDRALLLRASEELAAAAHKDDYEDNLDIFEGLIRDVWAMSLGRKSDQIVNEDIHSELSSIAKTLASQRAAAWIAQIEELRENLVVNINRKIATDALFLSMAAQRPLA